MKKIWWLIGYGYGTSGPVKRALVRAYNYPEAVKLAKLPDNEPVGYQTFDEVPDVLLICGYGNDDEFIQI